MAFCIGVDEAGRGPLAGPVAVGGVWTPREYPITEMFPGVADSKALSPKKRERLFALLQEKMREGEVRFHVACIDAKTIDTIGITASVLRGVTEVVTTLSKETESTHVYLDGLLHAPKEYVQETIVRGDATIPIISLASIAAKVTRDRIMEEYAKDHPLYSFEKHKGYGTKIHQDAIKTHGMCVLHRRSFVHIKTG
jgi:ribonuclease HII